MKVILPIVLLLIPFSLPLYIIFIIIIIKNKDIVQLRSDAVFIKKECCKTYIVIIKLKEMEKKVKCSFDDL